MGGGGTLVSGVAPLPGSELELEVRGVRLPIHDTLPAAALVVRRGDEERRGLSLHLAAGDAHALAHELRGQETPRSQAVGLLGQAVAALGGSVRAAHLRPAADGLLSAAVELETSRGRIEVPAAPGQALATAVRLGVPLLADACLLGQDSPAAAPLGGPLAAFLEDLDVTGLGDPAA